MVAGLGALNRHDRHSRAQRLSEIVYATDAYLKTPWENDETLLLSNLVQTITPIRSKEPPTSDLGFGAEIAPNDVDLSLFVDTRPSV